MNGMSYRLSLTDKLVEEYIHKHVFKSIRSKSLQKLLLVWFLLLDPKDMGHGDLCDLLRKRAKGDDHKPFLRRSLDLASYLKSEDVMIILNCSKRTAIDYIQTIQYLVKFS
jgi:hypothetical protein